MLNRQIVKKILVMMLALALTQAAGSQTAAGRCDSWEEVLAGKKGTVTALWDDIEPFIYVDKEGVLRGVEFEIMESFKDYLKVKYGIDLSITWERAGSFDNIYQKVKNSARSGIFGWSYYSITPAREKEVQFSLPYMPDINVLITNNQ
jgi:ABC-type amino acid transport substrate-binding protein